MTQVSDRHTAAELAQRIKNNRFDPSTEDEADRPRSDRPPAFVDALMSATPTSVERGARLRSADWDFICRALEHVAVCHLD